MTDPGTPGEDQWFVIHTAQNVLWNLHFLQLASSGTVVSATGLGEHVSSCCQLTKLGVNRLGVKQSENRLISPSLLGLHHTASAKPDEALPILNHNPNPAAMDVMGVHSRATPSPFPSLRWLVGAGSYVHQESHSDQLRVQKREKKLRMFLRLSTRVSGVSK